MNKNEELRKAVIEGILNHEKQVDIAKKFKVSTQRISTLKQELFKEETIKKLKEERKEMSKKAKEINKI